MLRRSASQVITVVLLFLAIVVGSVFFTSGFRHRAFEDSDLYYHFAVSKMESTEGALRSLPQVEDLEWSKQFPEKEYFFHRFTTWAYELGGEDGILLLIPILVSLIILVLFFEIYFRFGWLASVFGITFGIFLSPVFSDRLVFMRPHLLSILIFSGLLISSLRRWVWPSFILAFLYSLAYHSLFVPGAILAMSFAVGFIYKEKKSRWLALAGLAGLELGAVMNPYFPLNLDMMTNHIDLAFGSMENKIFDGIASTEMIPLGTYWFCAFYCFGAIILMISLFQWYRERPANSENPDAQNTNDRQQVLLLILLTVIFLVVTYLSPRGAEYLNPILVLLFGFSFPKLIQNRVLSSLVALGMILSFSLQWSALQGFYGFFQAEKRVNGNDITLNVLSHLPSGSVGAKIYNCDWTAGSTILYARPDLRFVDILSPQFLYKINPEKYEMKRQFLFVKKTDRYHIAHDVFKAQFVICEFPNVVRVLQRDPHFRFLYSSDEDPKFRVGSPTYLFQVD